MEGILRKVDKAIDLYFMENGFEPRFIVFSDQAYGDASYEAGRLEGMDDDNAYLNDLSEYKTIVVAVTHKRNFPDFELG